MGRKSAVRLFSSNGEGGGRDVKELKKRGGLDAFGRGFVGREDL